MVIAVKKKWERRRKFFKENKTNDNFDILPGSLLEITIKYNEMN